MCEECPGWVKAPCVEQTPGARVELEDQGELFRLKQLLIG